MHRTALTIVALSTVFVLVGCGRTETPSVATQTAETTDTSTATTSTSATPVATEAPAEGSKEAEMATRLATYAAPRLDGTQYVIGEQKGKALLLNVWATWCGPCRFEIPELKKLQAELGPKGLEVVGIAVDEAPTNEQEVRAFVTEKAIEYPIILDPEGRILLLLETSTVPTTVLLDKNGNVAWYSVGVVQSTNPGLQEAFAKVFAQE
ncbi:MAG: TlpA disulfide reductase family protein [Thermoanaerobaculia bacterium]